MVAMYFLVKLRLHQETGTVAHFFSFLRPNYFCMACKIYTCLLKAICAEATLCRSSFGNEAGWLLRFCLLYCEISGWEKSFEVPGFGLSKFERKCSRFLGSSIVIHLCSSFFELL